MRETGDLPRWDQGQTNGESLEQSEWGAAGFLRRVLWVSLCSCLIIFLHAYRSAEMRIQLDSFYRNYVLWTLKG